MGPKPEDRPADFLPAPENQGLRRPRARPVQLRPVSGILLAIVVLVMAAIPVPGGALAGPPPDVPGEMAEVTRVLSDLSIMRGWDGLFWPEQVFTREQLAAVGVRLAGLDDRAAALQGTPASMYVDAPPGQWWSSGYQAAAFESGIMRGWHTARGRVFMPEASVTFDETITIVLRVLGYETDAMRHNWPDAYRDRALELGLITPAVREAPHKRATRGEIAGIIGRAVLTVATADGSHLFPDVVDSNLTGDPSRTPPDLKAAHHDTYLNDYVQDIITTYQGNYPYLLNRDYANYNGVTRNLYYGGRLLARAHPSGNLANHCVGITFEVFFRAMQARNRHLGLPPDDFNGMTFDQLFDFLLTWYVASGDKQTSNITVAVERYGVGTRIWNKEEVRPGDFIDISRSNGTGHTAVFQHWVRDQRGKIMGVRYWSSQGSTNGIAYNTEYFDTSGRGNVYAHMVYIARVLPVHQYRPIR